MNQVRSYISFTGEGPSDVLGRNIDQLFESVNQFGNDVDDLGTLEIASFGPIKMDLSVLKTVTITHNLGYLPLFLVYLAEPGNFITPLPILDYGATTFPSANPASVVTAWADNSKLYINWLGTSQQSLQSFFYYIFKNPAA